MTSQRSFPWLISGVAFVAAIGMAASTIQPESVETGFDLGFVGIQEDDIEGHIQVLAAPGMEGRDSPSQGLTLSGDYIIQNFEAAGLTPVPGTGDFRIHFPRELPRPAPDLCSLSLLATGSEPEVLALGTDFVPLLDASGKASGNAVFVGFGISAPKERYDDLKGRSVEGAVAIAIEGEPRHRKVLGGPDVTAEGNAYRKVRALKKAGAVGVLLIRRDPHPDTKAAMRTAQKSAPLGFRHTWASWLGVRGDRRVPTSAGIPVLEISAEVGARILGRDPIELARRADSSGRPMRLKLKAIGVTMASGTSVGRVDIPNVVGYLQGSDPALREQFVVVGAHYDHLGVDARGRVGFGADDNASGTAALLEIAQAMAIAGPRRSVLFCAFAAEEDGLLGSRAFCENPPVPIPSIVAMLNFDMLGVGSKSEVVVLGTRQNPDLEKTLKRARKTRDCRLKRVITGKAGHLWERSDQFAFHEVGIPALFFFEAVSEQDNPDYHTFRDTIDLLDMVKITRTARLGFNSAWLLATDEERPSAPSR